jgi:serine O-acetyltransferase
MILNKQDYKRYLTSDEIAFDISTKGLKLKIIFFLKYHANSERYILLNYLKTVRRLEYLQNTKSGNYYFKILHFLCYLRIRKLSAKLHINIPINTLGEGALIMHFGTLRINQNAKIGKNCILQPGVFIGQKDSEENVPTVGDNVYFSPGSMAFGKIKIGNNVVVAPNSVVIKDVSDNCVVSGVPAKVIKQNGIKVTN